MSEHAWVLENIASYTVGGLEAAECERLREHVAACAPCAAALNEARTMDRTLEALFAEVSPDAGLEDRLVQALRTISRRGRLRSPLLGWVASSAAAVVLLGALGAGLSNIPVERALVFPGMFGAAGNDRAFAKNNLKQFGLAAHNYQSVIDQPVPPSTSNSSAAMYTTAYEMAEQLGQSSLGYSAGTRFSEKSVVVVGNATAVEANAGPRVAFRDIDPSRTVRNEEHESARSDSGIGTTSKLGKEISTLQAEQPALSAKRGAGGGSPTEEKYFMPSALSNLARQDPKPPVSNAGGEKQSSQSVPKLGADQGKAFGAKNPAEANFLSPVTPRKIIIRSGEIEFEIESFDAAVAAVTKLIGGIKTGFIAAVNSEKLANGKVRGAVVVLVPHEDLDGLILNLRKELGKGGELKGQRLGSQDISKQYTDLESRLRAARGMEERLLQIIKTGKGEIKDLLQAEKELGVWRTKIEELEGELRYYANQVALSTLTITLYEKELRAPSALIETERIHMGLEVEDVDKARQQTLAAVADAKGRITNSEFKQHEAGQYSALLQFVVAPEAAGPLRDRLKQLGNLARLEIDRLQQTEGGSGSPRDLNVKHGDAQFSVSLYNLAKVQPREAVDLRVACVDVEAVYQMILARTRKMAQRIITSNLNRPSKEQTTGIIKFEVRSADAETVLQYLKEAGEVIRLQMTENPDIQNTTRSKRGFSVSLVALDQVEPREKTNLQVATRDVPAGYRAVLDAVGRAKGRMLNAQLNEQDKQNITAQLEFEVRRSEEAVIEAALSRVGDAYARTVVRTQDTENVTDSKVRLKITLVNVAQIPPRATYTLAIEVGNVDGTAAACSALVHESQGRIVDAHIAHRSNGSIVAKQIFDVPLTAAPGLLEKFKGMGTVRVEEAARNPQVSESALATARLDVTLSNDKLIVPSDDGLWPQVRKGLSNSLLVIFWSLSWVIFGLLVVLPWALLLYGFYRLVLRLRRKARSPATAA